MTYYLESAEETKARLRAELAEEKVAEKTRADIVSRGFLPFGRKTVSNGETVVLVNDGALWDYEADDVYGAVISAQTIESLGGSAMIERAETWIDADSGQEYFVPDSLSFGELNLPCKKAVYTDSKGIILTMIEVHSRLGLGLLKDSENAGVCTDYQGRLTSVGTWISPADVIAEKTSGPCRLYAFEAKPSQAARRFTQMVKSASDKPVDSSQQASNSVSVDAQRLKAKWAVIAELANGRKNAPETEIPLPEGVGYAPIPDGPEKVMTRADRLAATRRRMAKSKPIAPVCQEKVAAKKDCERIIAETQGHLAAVKKELETLVPGRLLNAPFRKKECRIIKSDDEIARLKERAFHLRLVIRDERDEIENLGV